MKNQLQLFTVCLILSGLFASACGTRKRNSRQIVVKESRIQGTTNLPDSTRTSNNPSVYPDPNPAPIPNPQPNPPSPNPPMR